MMNGVQEFDNNSLEYFSGRDQDLFLVNQNK